MTFFHPYWLDGDLGNLLSWVSTGFTIEAFSDLSWWCFQIPNSWKQDCVHQVWGLESRNLMLRSGGCRNACTFRDVWCWQRRKARVSACWQSQHSIHRSPSAISHKQTSFDVYTMTLTAFQAKPRGYTLKCCPALHDSGWKKSCTTWNV